MVSRKRKSKAKSYDVDLLKLSDVERVRALREAKAAFRERVLEAKIWASLLDADVFTLNGTVVYRADEPLTGLKLEMK